MASRKDFLPNNDTELQAWLTNFVTILNANLATVGLVAADVTPLTTAQTNFNTAVTTHISTEAVFRNAVAAPNWKRPCAPLSAASITTPE